MSTLLQAQAALTEERRIYSFDPKALEALILKDLNLTAVEACVEFLVGSKWRGYGQGEHQEAVFTGVRVTSTKDAGPAPVTNGQWGDH